MAPFLCKRATGCELVIVGGVDLKKDLLLVAAVVEYSASENTDVLRITGKNAGVNDRSLVNKERLSALHDYFSDVMLSSAEINNVFVIYIHVIFGHRIGKYVKRLVSSIGFNGKI